MTAPGAYAHRTAMNLATSWFRRRAARARALARGEVPGGLETFARESAPRTPRDVFLYVISGHKPLNPAAATALLDRLR
jgi:DNA-directed RNA polymerase specialized sigma24 family protein